MCGDDIDTTIDEDRTSETPDEQPEAKSLDEEIGEGTVPSFSNSCSGLRFLGLRFTHCPKVSSVEHLLTCISTNIPLFFSALQKAGKHMEDSVVAAYVALLMGCIVQSSQVSQ